LSRASDTGALAERRHFSVAVSIFLPADIADFAGASDSARRISFVPSIATGPEGARTSGHVYQVFYD